MGNPIVPFLARRDIVASPMRSSAWRREADQSDRETGVVGGALVAETVPRKATRTRSRCICRSGILHASHGARPEPSEGLTSDALFVANATALRESGRTMNAIVRTARAGRSRSGEDNGNPTAAGPGAGPDERFT